MTRSYSSRVSPWATATSGVTFGSDPVTGIRASPTLAAEHCSVLDEASEERVEEEQAVGAAHGRLRRALGMGHEPDDRALFVTDAGDVPDRAVRVGAGGDLSGFRRIAEDDLLALPEL